jgi:hypothetical protein
MFIFYDRHSNRRLLVRLFHVSIFHTGDRQLVCLPYQTYKQTIARLFASRYQSSRQTIVNSIDMCIKHQDKRLLIRLFSMSRKSLCVKGGKQHNRLRGSVVVREWRPSTGPSPLLLSTYRMYCMTIRISFPSFLKQLILLPIDEIRYGLSRGKGTNFQRMADFEEKRGDQQTSEGQ